MEGTELSFPCRACGATLYATIEEAAHNEQLLDIVVTCEGCGDALNAFVDIDEMDKVGEV